MSLLAAVDFETRGAARFAFLTIDRSARANSLVPELVDALHEALDEMEKEDINGLVVRSRGAFFSSGGDVASFASRSGQALLDYSGNLVGGLQRAVLRLYALPVPVIARLQGGVTGGSIGLVLSADLIAMDSRAFMQPYYSEMGFAPDGGWTALLSERLSPVKAFSIQALNRRIKAEEALSLGLADALAPVDGLDGVIEGWLDGLAGKSLATLQATKRLLRDEAAIARMAERLDAERRAFLDLIALPDTALRMETFLN